MGIGIYYNELKEKLMKFILFAIATLFTGICVAQEVPPQPKFPKTPLNKYPKLPLELPPMPQKIIVMKDGMVPGLNNSQITVSPDMPQAKFIGKLPNGNIAFALPQDNMPCIIPNINASVAMPNVTTIPTLPFRYKGPGAIPNPAIPIQLIKAKAAPNSKPINKNSYKPDNKPNN